jgi:PEP-CTERM motif-containing protein
MRKLVLSLIGASALAIGSAASAVVIMPGPNTSDGTGGTTVFATSPNPVLPTTTGSITATIGHTGIADGSFTDMFRFRLPQDGLGSGSITTSVNFANFLMDTDLDIASVIITNMNGTFTAFETLTTASSTTFPFGVPCAVENTPDTCGANETFSANDVVISAGDLNTITVTGLSRGNGSYGGQITFNPTAPSVPEPATWAMMLLGFGGIGWQLRRKRSGGMLTQFA